MAMVLVKAKEVAANANGNVGIADAVMAVPHWFTDSQRRGAKEIFARPIILFCCFLFSVKLEIYL